MDDFNDDDLQAFLDEPLPDNVLTKPIKVVLPAKPLARPCNSFDMLAGGLCGNCLKRHY